MEIDNSRLEANESNPFKDVLTFVQRARSQVSRDGRNLPGAQQAEKAAAPVLGNVQGLQDLGNRG